MKILYLTNIPSPYRMDYFNELGKYCDLTVIFERKGHKTRDKSWQHFCIKYFNGIFFKGPEIGTYEKLGLEVIKYLKRGLYDYIVVTDMSSITGMVAIFWMRLRKINYCIEGDGAFAGSGKGLKEWIKKRLIGPAQICFSTSELHDEYYLKYGASDDKIYRYPFTSLYEKDILESPISLEEKRRLKEEVGISEKYNIIYVGSFIRRKGIDLLIKAVSELNDKWGIYLIGGTPTDEYLKLRKELKIEHLHFVEFKKSSDLKKYYMASDLFVLATREDIWGLVVNEAMANALPVITTKKCGAGCALIKNGYNGFLVENENVKELSHRIKNLVESQKVRLQCAKNALNTISEYTIENMVKADINVFLSNKNK